jgi:uncharacterized membrane protein YdjX (TVP38/TMEM64 family)
MMDRTRARSTSHRAAVLRLVTLGAFLAGAAFAWWQWGPTDAESLREIVRRTRRMRDSAWAGPMFLVIYGMAASIGLPITPLMLTAGAVFGAVLGAALSWAGAIAGAAGGHLIARRLGQSAFHTIMAARADHIEKLSASTGVLTLMRIMLIPLLPLSALNVATAVAGVPLRKYVAAATVGVIPGSVVFPYVADQIIAGATGIDTRSRIHVAVAALLLLTLTFVPVIVRKAGRR